METVIGFVIGYLVGASEGKGGVERLKASVSAIISSPEAHNLIGQAIQIAEPMVRQAGSGAIGGIGGNVVRQLVNRAAGVREETRAA
ncbi:MAG TPA: hypothetical protein VGH27_12490 [Streptosporangiaceae bacterium]|jgi:hypothetical protein